MRQEQERWHMVRGPCRSAAYRRLVPSTYNAQLTTTWNFNSGGSSDLTSEGTHMHTNIPNPQIYIIKNQILNKTSKNRWRREEETREKEQRWKRMEKRRKRLCKACYTVPPQTSALALSGQVLVPKPEPRLCSKLCLHTA